VIFLLAQCGSIPAQWPLILVVSDLTTDWKQWQVIHMLPHQSKSVIAHMSAQISVTPGSTQLQSPCRPYVMQSALDWFAGLALKLAFFPDDVSGSSKDMGKQSKDDTLL